MIARTLRRFTLPALLLATALVFGACSNDGDGAVADLSDLTPAEALERARAAVEAADGFNFTLSHISGTTKLAGGLDLQRAEGSVKRPGDMSLTAEARFGRAFIRTEAVVIGDETWMTNPLTGTWAKIAPGDSPFAFLDPILVVANIIDNVSAPSFAEVPGHNGRVLVNGRVAAGAFEPLVGEVADTVVDVTLELEADTFRLIKARVRGVLQDGDLDSAERLIELSGYDSFIDITPPI